MHNTSSQLYKFVSNLVIEYFDSQKIQAGDRFNLYLEEERHIVNLYNALKVINLNTNGEQVKAVVGVGVYNKHSQVYKAVTHELGAVRKFPGGQPYFVNDGRPVWVSRRSMLAEYLPKTQPYTVTIPARPFIKPAKEAKLEDVKSEILARLMEAYKNA
jgi:hypothetical protein